MNTAHKSTEDVVRTLTSTHEALLADLAHSCRTLAEDDSAGRRWSRDNRYRGYTSYASLNDLPWRFPIFADLEKALAKAHLPPKDTEKPWQGSRR